jgi:hypothetical protein
MAKDCCVRHPEIAATASCRQCGIPICDQCKLVRAEGAFCSEACEEKYGKFKDRYSSMKKVNPHRLPGIFSLRALYFAIGVAIVGLIVLHFFFDVNSVGDLPDGISRLLYWVFHFGS